MKTVRQPDATRGRAANFWYEVRMRDSKKEELRRVLMKEMHPVEKLMRIGLGSLTVEGLPRGRYRLLHEKEVAALRQARLKQQRGDLKNTKELLRSVRGGTADTEREGKTSR